MTSGTPQPTPHCSTPSSKVTYSSTPLSATPTPRAHAAPFAAVASIDPTWSAKSHWSKQSECSSARSRALAVGAGVGRGVGAGVGVARQTPSSAYSAATSSAPSARLQICTVRIAPSKKRVSDARPPR